MKYLSRSAVVLVFAMALSALPAHAAPHPARRAHATPAPQSVVARLSTAWAQLTHLFAATTVAPPPNNTTIDGGSCIDPNGLGQAQLIR